MIRIDQILGLALFTTALAFGWLALWPTSGVSYRCARPPIVTLASPQVERDDTYFFDEGTQCNTDARVRGWALLPTGFVGLGLLAGLAIERRRHGAGDRAPAP